MRPPGLGDGIPIHCEGPPLTCTPTDVLPAGQSESVRDVQFSIRDYFTFASTFENGNVQLWDIRRPDRCERMFTAHNGPVFCCDWHPEDRWGALGPRGRAGGACGRALPASSPSRQRSGSPPPARGP